MLARLANEIEAHGWISFARYMQLVLHEPGLGYYAAGRAKFGRAGDFVTAPELGKLFGRTLARQLRQIGGPVLEIGAGSGALAEALLGESPREYLILETSAELRERQRARLGNRVQFIDRLPARLAGRRSMNCTRFPRRARWRSRSSALVSRIRYSRGDSPSRASASAPLPAPISSTGPPICLNCRASVRPNSLPSSGAVTKSPAR